MFAVWVYCLLDVIMAEEYRIRNLSKGTWIMIVLFTFEVGAIAWLVAGRPQSATRGLPYKGNNGRPAPQYPEYDRPGRFSAAHPDDDDAFLRQVRNGRLSSAGSRESSARHASARPRRSATGRDPATRARAPTPPNQTRRSRDSGHPTGHVPHRRPSGSLPSADDQRQPRKDQVGGPAHREDDEGTPEGCGQQPDRGRDRPTSEAAGAPSSRAGELPAARTVRADSPAHPAVRGFVGHESWSRTPVSLVSGSPYP